MISCRKRNSLTANGTYRFEVCYLLLCSLVDNADCTGDQKHSSQKKVVSKMYSVLTYFPVINVTHFAPAKVLYN